MQRPPIVALMGTILLTLVAGPSAAERDEWQVDSRRPGRIEGSPSEPTDYWRYRARIAEYPNPYGWKVDRRRPGWPYRGQGSAVSREMELLDTGTIRLHDVLFEVDKAVLRSDSYVTLNDVGRVLVAWPELRVEIAGHTDNWADDDYNLRLSRRRAEAVQRYLLETFPSIESSQLTARGYGESRPIATNDTPRGRAQNRRVEFTVLNRGILRQ